MQVNILAETKHYIVINKPANMLVHSDGRNNDVPTVTDWVRENYPDIVGVGETMTLHDGTIIDRPGIVHRLDCDTSGVLIIARTDAMFEHLKSQFKNHMVQKTYLAYVYGHVTDDRGVIDEPIGKSKKDFRRWHAGRGTRGTLREAVTEYEVVERFNAGSSTTPQSPPQRGGEDEEPFTFVELHPKTGRTHQLRVHMKYLNHPIVADELYGGKRYNKSHNLGFNRQALHAQRIVFTDMENNQIEIEAPLLDDFISVQGA